MKTTIKEIREFRAIDITTYSSEEYKKLREKESASGGYLREIAWAPCKYGTGAMLIYGTGSHNFYKIINALK